MKFPELVPNKVCRTSIKIQFENGLEEDGSPKKTVLFAGFCNWKETGRIVFDKERKAVNLTGIALLNGDPLKDAEFLEGKVYVGEGKTAHKIHAYDRARNPDGTVNYTKLELV